MAGPPRVHIKMRLGSYIHFCGAVAGWRVLRVRTSLLSKFPLWYEIVLAGWRSGSVSHCGRLWNGICSVSVSVHLGFGNEPQRSKLNRDSHNVQWLCEGKIHFVFNFWKISQKQFDASSMTPLPRLVEQELLQVHYNTLSGLMQRG